MNPRLLPPLCLVAFLCLALLTGCNRSGGRVTIHGKVTFDGTPLDEGGVTFIPSGGSGVSSGGAITAGAYTAEIMPGKYVVQITANRKTGRMLPVPPGEPPLEEYEQYLPAKYNTQSTLSIDVEAKSKQDFSFPLEQ